MPGLLLIYEGILTPTPPGEVPYRTVFGKDGDLEKACADPLFPWRSEGELEFAAMQHRGWRGFELDWRAVHGEVIVPFWLRPGAAAVTLGPGEEREVERIPKQLGRFL